MTFALLTADRGGSGGFERLVRRVSASARARGIDLTGVQVDGRRVEDRMFGLDVGESLRQHHREFFLYVSALEKVDRLDLGGYDAVLTTHAPTFLATHPAVVALFYHQNRVFYDLSDEYVRSGFVDSELHEAARAQVRRIDADRVQSVSCWLAGSNHVADRIDRYWGIRDRVVPFRAAPELPSDERDAALDGYDPHGPAICVSRHEWPKRTELVIQSAFLPGDDGEWELIGGGSRSGHLEHLIHRLHRDPDAAAELRDTETWLNTGHARAHSDELPEVPGLRVHGETSDRIRDDAYRRAGVVVAPAYNEDYGLTALEAFARGRPVVVCEDGGGLVELVADTGAGIVVPPDPVAIRNAVASLRDDPERARAMAVAALDTAATYRHEDAVTTVLDALEAAAESR